MWDSGRESGRLAGYFAGEAIAIWLTVRVGWRLGDGQSSGGEESGQNGAEASHLDVLCCMYTKAGWNT